jgi:phosphatidate cytidylyltransferase
MIVRVLAIYLSAFLLGGTGLYAASRNKPDAVRRERRVKFITYFCIVNLVLLAALAGHWIFAALMAVIVVMGARELYGALPRASGGSLLRTCAIGISYALVAAAALSFAYCSLSYAAVFVYLVVCAFDGFSQVAGQLLGRHQLAPAISPGKTIEGSIGGLLFALGFAVVLRPLIGITILQSLFFSCFIALAALCGDLMASIIKRRSNIKDFSQVLPGHGGILDRFDSFLFAAAACMTAALAGQWLLGTVQSAAAGR